MSSQAVSPPFTDFDRARARWEQEYEKQISSSDERRNRSGIAIKPLYTPQNWRGERYVEDLGFPGQLPMTRGIYPTMHRGRPWSQRQLIGLGTPEDYNQRFRALLAAGVTAGSLIPCNSVYRGYDMDEVDPLLLGTCGAVINTVEHMAACFRDVPIDRISVGLNDPSPFTLLAFYLAHAKRTGVPWSKITGTSNQSDYISHFVCNHMFYRLSLAGSRRVLTDHVQFVSLHLPGWNPVSVVGQHMQQGGATPAEAMGFTLSTAIQYAGDCIERGMDPDRFLPLFTFFFDISLSFFEEVAKFRAGRRIWARIVRERFGAKAPRSWRFKFHAQTSGVELTRQQPLNNVTRVAVQAMAGIFGGLQSLHTDAYDEALSTPNAEAARVAVSTQNILREEAHLADVIDPLGGSYYVETLTNEMEALIGSVIAKIDEAGGMSKAVESGLVQQMIGESALEFQDKIEKGEQIVVGVNAYRVEENGAAREPVRYPDPSLMDAHLAAFRKYRAERSQSAVQHGLDALARAANSPDENVFGKVIEAAEAGATHGEICACLRRELGFGHPLIVP